MKTKRIHFEMDQSSPIYNMYEQYQDLGEWVKATNKNKFDIDTWWVNVTMNNGKKIYR